MKEKGLRARFKKVDITPDYPVRLAGYFNERISTGILDRLHMRLAAFESGESRLLFVQVDNCAIKTEEASEIREAIARAGRFERREIMVWTSHIHTGPDLVGFFGLPRDDRYLADLRQRIVGEVEALDPREKCCVRIARAAYEDLSYNRRWRLKDGSVMTNPPKLYSEMEEPEGIVDREANTVAFVGENGSYLALFINISNHTDTIGGTMISADWPGIMEKRLDNRLGAEVPVFPFIAPQGNINHLEFHDPRPQSGYDEAERLGAAYAGIIAGSLKSLKPVRVDGMRADEVALEIPPMDVPGFDLAQAEKVLEKSKAGARDNARTLTAEDLAKGDPVVEKIFAESLVDFARNRPALYQVPLQVLALGRIAIAAIPGEPFVEIGLKLKTIKGFDLIFPTALANGYFGYIPLEECFGRGGYETRPGAASYLAKDADKRILAAFRSLLTRNVG